MTGRAGWAGAAFLLLATLLALLAQLGGAAAPDGVEIGRRLLPSSLTHPLGTDQLGRDLLTMLLAGAGPPLATAALSTLIGTAAGVPLGLFAAARPGIGDELLTRAGDVLFAFPALVLALLVVALLGPGVLPVSLAIGLVNVPVFLRVARAAARGVLARDFVAAARLAGAGPGAVAWRHVLPNVAPALVTQAAVAFSFGLLGETSLAFLGLGAQPPAASWGRMVADAQTLAGTNPRLVLWPGGCIVATVLAANVVADGLRRHRP